MVFPLAPSQNLVPAQPKSVQSLAFKIEICHQDESKTILGGLENTELPKLLMIFLPQNSGFDS
jgi:hypothetical protein